MIFAVRPNVSTAERQVTVEVMFAGAGQPVLYRRIEVDVGCTLMQAIQACGIVDLLPANIMDPRRLGVFGHKASPDQQVRDGDRIEIYRPLRLDPMEARRRRAR
jgi:putative ubiquitin-RnfH superfamily antitoxin RatB of RatAB toxin-antitoxin module